MQNYVIPEGWRELEDNETIAEGDMFFNRMSSQKDVITSSQGKIYGKQKREQNYGNWIVITKSPLPYLSYKQLNVGQVFYVSEKNKLHKYIKSDLGAINLSNGYSDKGVHANVEVFLMVA